MALKIQIPNPYLNSSFPQPFQFPIDKDKLGPGGGGDRPKLKQKVGRPSQGQATPRPKEKWVPVTSIQSPKKFHGTPLDVECLKKESLSRISVVPMVGDLILNLDSSSRVCSEHIRYGLIRSHYQEYLDDPNVSTVGLLLVPKIYNTEEESQTDAFGEYFEQHKIKLPFVSLKTAHLKKIEKEKLSAFSDAGIDLQYIVIEKKYTKHPVVWALIEKALDTLVFYPWAYPPRLQQKIEKTNRGAKMKTLEEVEQYNKKVETILDLQYQHLDWLLFSFGLGPSDIIFAND